MSCFEVSKPLRNACCLPELKRLNSSTWVNLSPWPDQKLCECFESLSGNKGKVESTNDFYSWQASNREKGLTKVWRHLGSIYQSLVVPFDLVVATALFRYGHLTQPLCFMRLEGSNGSFLASTPKLPDSEGRSWTHFLMKTRRSSNETAGLQTLRLLQALGLKKENVGLKRLGWPSFHAAWSRSLWFR